MNGLLFIISESTKDALYIKKKFYYVGVGVYGKVEPHAASDAIISSWLWSTATWGCPLNNFDSIIEVVDN